MMNITITGKTTDAIKDYVENECVEEEIYNYLKKD